MSLSDQVTTRFGMNVEYVSTIRKIMSENTKCIHVIKGNICSRHIVLYYIFSENVLFVLLAIELSVLLRFTDSDYLPFYLFGIVKLFLSNLIKISCYNIYTTLPLASDRTRLEVMSRWTLDQPMKTLLV